MNKLLLITLLATLSLFATAQKANADSRLSVKFSAADIAKMTNSEVIFYNYCIDNAFRISDLPAEKSNASEISGDIVISDLNNVNFYSLNIDLLEEKFQYFRITGTNKLLIVKPISEIKTEL